MAHRQRGSEVPLEERDAGVPEMRYRRVHRVFQWEKDLVLVLEGAGFGERGHGACARVFRPEAEGSEAAVKVKSETGILYPVSLLSFIIQTYSTVHPSGTPFSPVISHLAALFLMNVPDGETPSTQPYKHISDETSVASILI